MAKTKISEFSATPGNNTDIDGINIAEGCAPSGINDAIRELMSQLKDFQAGTAGDSFNGPVGTTTAAAGAFTTLSASSTVSGTGFSTYLASPPAIGGTAAAAGSFTNLSSSGTVSGTGFSNYLASPPSIGGTTPAAGSFTTLSASGNITVSGGTANGVAYLNGSKVLTTGSALTFDGTNLGIGTSSPGAKFEVVGGDTRLRNSYNWNYSNLDIIRNASNTATPRFLALMLDGDSLGSTTIGAYNAIWGAYDSSPTTGSTSSGLNGAMVYGAYAGHRWYTNGSERARIDSSGNLLVGTTTTDIWVGSATNTGFRIEPNGTTTVARSGYAALLVKRTNASTGNMVEFGYGTTQVGSISTNGTGTTYGTSSDYRLKENVQPMTGALAKVSALKPCTYKWKADGSEGEGFIAHELQAVVPDAVTGQKDAVDANGKPVYQGIDTSFLVATLTAAIQEQQALIESLTTRIAALEGK